MKGQPQHLSGLFPYPRASPWYSCAQSIFRLPCFPFWALVLTPGSVRGTYCLSMTRVVPYPGLPSVEYGLVPKAEFFSLLFTSPQNSIKVKTRGGRTEAEAKAQSPDESAWATK